MNTNRTQTPKNNNEGDGLGRISKMAYRDGYLHGRDLEHSVQEENRVVRDNNTAASGLLLGITIASLAGLLGGALYFVTHQNQPTTTPVRTAPAPTISQPQPTQKQTTVIERTVNTTKEVIPVPQQQAPEAQTSPTQPETTENESAENEVPARGSQP